MSTWRSIAVVVLSAIATVVASDFLLQQVMPVPERRIEVQDGVEALEDGDPEILLIGSSHARSFAPIRDRLRALSDGARDTVLVAVEYGKLTSYAWVLDHRLTPLVDERGPDGRLVRPSLRRLVLVTEWWDACAPPQGLASNIPARAFTVADLLTDVLANGLTEWNKNWAAWRWRQPLRWSVLLQDRGVNRLRGALREAAGLAPSDEEARWAYDRQVEEWQVMTEDGATDPLCRHPQEQQAIEHIVAWGQERHLDITIVLFPRMPATLTEKARETTIAAYRDRIEALGRATGVRVVDLSDAPVTDADFMQDFDHLRPEGNRKLADWALADKLSFLLQPPPAASTPAAGAR